MANFTCFEILQILLSVKKIINIEKPSAIHVFGTAVRTKNSRELLTVRYQVKLESNNMAI